MDFYVKALELRNARQHGPGYVAGRTAYLPDHGSAGLLEGWMSEDRFQPADGRG